jgi:hypothetical protein
LVAGDLSRELRGTAQALLGRVDPAVLAVRGRAAVQDGLRAANEALQLCAMRAMPDQGQPVSQGVRTALEPLAGLIAELHRYQAEFRALDEQLRRSES